MCVVVTSRLTIQTLSITTPGEYNIQIMMNSATVPHFYYDMLSISSAYFYNLPGGDRCGDGVVTVADSNNFVETTADQLYGIRLANKHYFVFQTSWEGFPVLATIPKSTPTTCSDANNCGTTRYYFKFAPDLLKIQFWGLINTATSGVNLYDCVSSTGWCFQQQYFYRRMSFVHRDITYRSNDQQLGMDQTGWHYDWFWHKRHC